jgi:hypothetical protein
MDLQDDDGVTIIWDCFTGDQNQVIPNVKGGAVTSLAWFLGNSGLAIGYENGTITLRGLMSNKEQVYLFLEFSFGCTY